MIYAYTVEQLRSAEQRALGRTRPGALMQQAAFAVATRVGRELLRRTGAVTGRRVTVLVGTGNNGGDALYAGALLAGRGAKVMAVLLDPDRTHAAALAALRRAGGAAVGWDPSMARTEAAGPLQAEMLIDGLVGIGATGPLRGACAEVVHALQHAGRRFVVAVDLPSGIDPNTGVAPGVAICADVTVTFGAPSTGLLLAAQTGELDVVELSLIPAGDPDAVSYQPSDLPSSVPGPDDDKFSTGVLGIHAGSPGYPGAAVLCVGAAVRARPGLIRFAGSQASAVLARWPEVVAAPSIAACGRVQAWVIGPGMGTDGTAVVALDQALAAEVPVLVDADGLTVLAGHPGLLARRVSRQLPTVVLTPHGREFARLFPDLDPAAAGGPDRLTATREAAARSGAVVLLKGHRTVIAAPDGRTAINRTGSGALATAGSGDVLSGLIGSLLATGRDAFESAALGALRHGLAGAAAERAGRCGAQQLWEYV